MGEMRAIGNRVIVDVERPGETITENGLVQLPSDRPLQGKVVAVGAKVHELKVGDTVLLGRARSVPVEIYGKVYFLYQEDDLPAILEA